MSMQPKKSIKCGAEDRPPMVISYLRFSSAEQIKGDSTRRQLDMSERYAAERGWEIDKSMSDKGVSAFRGSNATSGALSTLLQLVKDGKIPRGSVLLVESLDRLSRNEISEALELFLGLVRSGIRLVTLADGYEYRQGQLELSNLMYSLMVMSRAHEESATKSRRIGEAWKAKRQRIDKEPLTGMVPAWLSVLNGKIVVDRQKASVVKRIFAMAIEGRGITHIVKALNTDKSSIGWRCDYWQRSYISKILHSRAVIGEFQPHKVIHQNGKRTRTPTGEPMKNYYPAVVDEQDFYAAQAALKSRINHTGPSSKYLNLFKGLLFDAQDQSPLQMRTKGTRSYASSAAMNGLSKSACIGFPVPAFEAAFLAIVSETTSLDLKDNRVAELNQQIRAVTGRLDAVNKRIATISAALSDADNEQSAAALVPVLGKLDGERQAYTVESEGIRQQLATAQMGSPNEAAERIAKVMAGSLTGRMSPSIRFELQQAIAQLVERIECRTQRDGPCTTCTVTVTLKNRSAITYTATVKNRDRGSVVITDDSGDKTYVEVEIDGQRRGGVSLYVEDQVRQLWQDSIRPAIIAKRCGVSMNQVYRIAGSLPRLKKWRPANRWDKRKADAA
jgi:DNA invertase Pin-like site-specific DNA recombinase